MTVRFVQISDTHLGPDPGFTLYGVNTFRAAERLVEAVNAAPAEASFVVHTGDITASPDQRSYELANEVFGRFRLPVYYVAGNHDDSAMIRTILQRAPCSPVPDGTGRLSYRFVRDGHTFLVLDARGPDTIDPHGILGEDQFDALAAELRHDGGPLTLFVHFPPLGMDSAWMDDEMLLLNGGRLHAVLRGSPRVRGVFYGHVHRPTASMRDGILYSSVGSSFRQFAFWPRSEKVALDTAPAATFGLVSLHGGGISVQHHSVPLGEPSLPL